MLLLGGDLPVPYPRQTDVLIRSRWDGVPPGRHALRRSDGRVVPIDVTDGESIDLPE